MTKKMQWHDGTETRTECVYIVQCFQKSEPFIGRNGRKQYGRWVTCYDWVYAAGEERKPAREIRLDDKQRKLLAKLKQKSQGYTGRPGALNLHHNSLAYLTLADCMEAIRLIRKHKSCRYKVRPARETCWKETVIIPERAEQHQIPEPFDILPR